MRRRLEVLWILVVISGLAAEVAADPVVPGAAGALRVGPAHPQPLRRLAERIVAEPQDRAGDPLHAVAEAQGPQGVLPSPRESRPLGPPRTSPQAEPEGPGSDPGTGRGSAWEGAWVLNTVTALGTVLGLIVIVRTVLGRWSAARPSGSARAVVEVLGRISVAPRNHVLLLRAGSRVLVLGDSPAGLRTLCDISDPEEVDRVLSTLSTSSPGSISRGFSQLLGNFQKDHEQTDSQGGPHQVHDLTARARDRVGNLLGRIRMHTEGRAAP